MSMAMGWLTPLWSTIYLPTNSTVTVRRSNGTQFLPNEDWTHGPYSVGNAAYFADVTGDGCADAIVINNLPTNSTVTVRRAR
jgi:hypothetical protein